jgi:hypothetical protein
LAGVRHPQVDLNGLFHDEIPNASFSFQYFGSVFQSSIHFPGYPTLSGVIPSHGVARNRLRRTFGLPVLTVFAAFPWAPCGRSLFVVLKQFIPDVLYSPQPRQSRFLAAARLGMTPG